jgi:hypothetical protein
MKMKLISFLTVVSMMFLAGCIHQTANGGFVNGFSGNAVSMDKRVKPNRELD